MADADTQASDAPAEPTGIKKLLPLLLAGLVGVGGGAGLGLFVAGPALTKGLVVPAKAKGDAHADGDADAHGEEAGAEEGADAEPAAEEGGDGEAKDKAPAAPEIHTLENLVLNPANSGGARFLLLSIAVEVRNAKSLEALKARDAELRDAVLGTLGRQDVETLIDIARRDSVKAEIARAIDQRFGKKTVKRLFFPQWVIQ